MVDQPQGEGAFPQDLIDADKFGAGPDYAAIYDEFTVARELSKKGQFNQDDLDLTLSKLWELIEDCDDAQERADEFERRLKKLLV
jgi:hypothetical protein